jgi:hypothetical protein
LVTALVACADDCSKSGARRFLAGLSADELQFIADFLGACILETSAKPDCSRAQLAARIERFQDAREDLCARWSEDRDHKMILLLEYLCRGGIHPFSMTARAGS